MVTFSVLFVTLKLFEYFNKSKSMRSLIEVLTSIKEELINFLLIFFCILGGFVFMAHLSFGSQVQEFSTLPVSIMNTFEITLPNNFDFVFLDQTKQHASMMSQIFFIPLTVMFLFIFANIFLAIMMNSYENNIGRFKNHEQSDGKEESEELSLLKSFFYCALPNHSIEDSAEIAKSRMKKIVSKEKKNKEDKEDLVLGLNQMNPFEEKPDYLEEGFDPYDPSARYNREDYLQ